MASVLKLETLYLHTKRKPDSSNKYRDDFNIIKVEDLLLPTEKSTSYSRRSYFKVSLVRGHSKIYYADQLIEITDSALVFTNPMIPYQWERVTEQQSGFMCVFREDFFSKSGPVRNYPVFNCASNAVLLLSPLQTMFFENIFQKMVQELNGDYLYKNDLLRTLVMEVIHEAQKLQPAAGIAQTPSSSLERISVLFKDLLEMQFPIEQSDQRIQNSSPGAFASQLNIHVNHLNKALKETTGETTSHLINLRVIQEAKILLKNSDWPVRAIGWSLGFDEAHHFSSFFKRYTKFTPRQFKAQP